MSISSRQSIPPASVYIDKIITARRDIPPLWNGMETCWQDGLGTKSKEGIVACNIITTCDFIKVRGPGYIKEPFFFNHNIIGKLISPDDTKSLRQKKQSKLSNKNQAKIEVNIHGQLESTGIKVLRRSGHGVAKENMARVNSSFVLLIDYSTKIRSFILMRKIVNIAAFSDVSNQLKSNRTIWHSFLVVFNMSWSPSSSEQSKTKHWLFLCDTP